jgi:hypothetical protein
MNPVIEAQLVDQGYADYAEPEPKPMPEPEAKEPEEKEQPVAELETATVSPPSNAARRVGRPKSRKQ